MLLIESPAVHTSAVQVNLCTASSRLHQCHSAAGGSLAVDKHSDPQPQPLKLRGVRGGVGGLKGSLDSAALLLFD